MVAFGPVAGHAVAALPQSASINVNLAGVSATALAGSFAPGVAVTVAGVALTASPGTLASAPSIVLPAVAATASAGTPSTALQAFPSGVSAAVSVGTVETAQALGSLPGAAASARAGQILAGVAPPILVGVSAQPALGVITFDITRGGSSYPRKVGAPLPAFDVKPAKPFQPIWDKVRQQEAEAARPKPEPAPIIGPPPAELFAPTDRSLGPLPDFSSLGVHDPIALGRMVREGEDRSDAAAAIAAHLEREAQDAADALAAIRAAAHAAAQPPPAAPPAPPPSVALPPRPVSAPPLSPAPNPMRLPTFDHFASPDLRERVEDAQDVSDALAVLKLLGLKLQ